MTYTQMTVFDVMPTVKINEELRKQRRMIKDYDIDYLSMWYYITPYKCCGCYPKLQQKWVGFYNALCYARCCNCGRETEPVDDYSWMQTKKNWDQMMKGEADD